MNLPVVFPFVPETWYNETLTFDIGVSVSLLNTPSYLFSFPVLLSTQTLPPSSNVKSIVSGGLSGGFSSGGLFPFFPVTVAVYTVP